MKIVSSLIILWTFALCTYAQTTVYHRVVIDDSKENLDLLRHTGMGSVLYMHNAEYVAELSADDLKILDDANVDYTIRIRDISGFYEQRNRGKNPAEITSGISARGEYDVPENFSLGSMGGFFRLDEIIQQMDNMHALFPDLITQKTALPTLSYEGNPIYWVKISDNPEVDEDEPEVFYNSLTHAREPASAAQLIYFMYHLLENYDANPGLKRIVDNTELYFILCINPDGYLYNEQCYPDGGGMWRKNRSLNNNGSRGIDPNRNFGYMWGHDDIGSSPVPNSSTYRGDSAWSAPEAQAVKAFAQSRDFKLVINGHSFGDMLLHPWGYVSYYTPDDYDQLRDMASVLTYKNHFRFGSPSKCIYPVNGDATDWFYGEEVEKPSAFAFTSEVGNDEFGFWPPMEEIIPQCESCLEMNILAAEMAGCYTSIFDAGPMNIEKNEGYLTFGLKRFGLTNMPFEVSISAANDVFDSLGMVSTIQHIPTTGLLKDSVYYRLKNGLKPGDAIKYVIKIENESYISTDTLSKIFGQERVLIYDHFDDLVHWETDQWAYRDNLFASPQFSASNVENSYYANNAQSFMYLNDTVEISDSDYAWVNFKAIWDLDGGRDYIRLVYSDDYGQQWKTLQGRYSSRIFLDSGMTFVYEGQVKEWVDEWVLLDSIKGKPLRFGFQFTSDAKYGRSGFYCDDFSVFAADMQKVEQPIVVGLGWTGISSFILPDHSKIEIILEDNINAIEFLTDGSGFFRPGNPDNSLTDWDTDDGYMIKASQPFTLIMEGYPEKSNRLLLQSGWNLVSIISEEQVSVDSLATYPPNRIIAIKEACGSLASWPAQDINTLQYLRPGSSYYIMVISDATLIME